METPASVKKLKPAPTTKDVHQQLNFDKILRLSFKHSHHAEHVLKRFEIFHQVGQFLVNAVLWSVFMNDCMWAVFYLIEEGEKSREFTKITKFSKHRRSLKLCKPDFKTLQTLPQNSMKLQCGKIGKQFPGIICVCWSCQEENLLRTDEHVS